MKALYITCLTLLISSSQIACAREMHVKSQMTPDQKHDLGVIESKFKAIEMPATVEQLQGVASLSISVENKGGVPNEQGPRLPWLFQGPLVNKAL